jgi:hypothetical protein
MPRNDAAAPDQVCPGIRIHAIDIVQPPGIGIPPIADMDAHQTIVAAALAVKSSAETPRKARWEARSGTMNVVSTPRVRSRDVRIARLRCWDDKYDAATSALQSGSCATTSLTARRTRHDGGATPS